MIHLAAEQLEKKANKVIDGENLDILIGSIPVGKKDEKELKERVKANILNILKEQYGIEEEDFLSAEIEVVPAGAARDYGFDRSMIMGYGHDDRVCAYPSFEAILQMEKPKHTSVCLLVDKEEIGSVGATGTSELGKVDQGGGGTIAYILANYGMQVIDSGVAVLNMHAPWEIISKADLYEAFKGYVAFLKEA